MHASRASLTESFSPSSLPQPIHEETLWQLNMRAIKAMESGPYPKRPGEPDCTYYIGTGLCRFGMTCRYNHPPNRKMAVAAARIKEGYPERIGQPECQYYLKTGTCKFGATCKFHHPRDVAGIAGRVRLNMFGYPLRPNEKECAYYLRTGQCKFGNTCKFHHPQLSNAVVTVRGSAVYTPVDSLTTPGPQSYPGGLTNWPLSRASFIPSPRWQGPSNYAPVVLPQGLVQVPGWNAFPGEPLCIFYSRYGICKFGANCKFDHPMGIFACNLSTSSSADVPVVRRLLGSSSGPPALTLPSEGSAETGTGKPR